MPFLSLAWMLLLAAAAPVALPAVLPVSQAETLGGHKLAFPTALAGKPAVCLFGFSKEAGDGVKVWMARLMKDGVEAWSIADLEEAPSLIRGMIRGSMKHDTPAALYERSLVLTKDTKAWKQVLGATKDSLPVAALIDAQGRLVWTYEGNFGDEPYRELRSRLAAVRN